MSATDRPMTAPLTDARALSERLAGVFDADQARQQRHGGDQLAAALRQGGVGEFQAGSAYAACLLPLLNAIGWRGALRDLAETLPHFANTLDREDLISTLAHLGYRTRVIDGRVAALDRRLLPCLLERADGAAQVVLTALGDGRFRVFDGESKTEQDIDGETLEGRIHLVHPASAPKAAKRDNWFGDMMARFSGLIARLFGITLILNTLSLAVPLFIMTLYDQVIPAHSGRILIGLAGGVLLALAIEFGFRLVRGKILASIGGRLENIIATSTFGQLLALPAALTENATVGAQAARLKEFDSIRDLVTGPMVSVGLELPFVVLFLAVIAWLGGPLAYVPLALIGVYLLIGAAIMPSLRGSIAKAARARAARHAFNVEMMSHARAIKQLALETVWLERFRDISARAAHAHFRTAQLSFLLQTVAQAIMMGAGVATVVFGTLRVMAGDMSMGALIAVMALVWRVLSPLQNLFLAMTRYEQAKQSVSQLNQLMRMPVESRQHKPARVDMAIAGALAFERVSFRYRPDSEPAMIGVSLKIPVGGILGVTGGNGAGKSTLLALAAGLYRPQAGIITIDGVDIRQMDPVDLRRQVAYVAQDSHMFHGTIAQNLRLGHPTASDDDLYTVCVQLGIQDQIAALPDGIETRIGDQRVQQLNVGFKQRLAIARALLRKPRLLLLDEAARALDFEGDQAFADMIRGLRGNTTVVMVSHRPSHLKLCDQMIVLEAGAVVAAGKPDEVLPAMQGAAA